VQLEPRERKERGQEQCQPGKISLELYLGEAGDRGLVTASQRATNRVGQGAFDGPVPVRWVRRRRPADEHAVIDEQDGRGVGDIDVVHLAKLGQQLAGFRLRVLVLRDEDVEIVHHQDSKEVHHVFAVKATLFMEHDDERISVRRSNEGSREDEQYEGDGDTPSCHYNHPINTAANMPAPSKNMRIPDAKCNLPSLADRHRSARAVVVNPKWTANVMKRSGSTKMKL